MPLTRYIVFYYEGKMNKNKKDSGFYIVIVPHNILSTNVFTEKRQSFTENMLSGNMSGVTLHFC